MFVVTILQSFPWEILKCFNASMSKVLPRINRTTDRTVVKAREKEYSGCSAGGGIKGDDKRVLVAEFALQ